MRYVCCWIIQFIGETMNAIGWRLVVIGSRLERVGYWMQDIANYAQGRGNGPYPR